MLRLSRFMSLEPTNSQGKMLNIALRINANDKRLPNMAVLLLNGTSRIQKDMDMDTGMDTGMDTVTDTQKAIMAMSINLNQFGIREIGSKRNRHWAMI